MRFLRVFDVPLLAIRNCILDNILIDTNVNHYIKRMSFQETGIFIQFFNQVFNEINMKLISKSGYRLLYS